MIPIDAGALADAIDRVLTDSELAQRLQRKGRELVTQHRDRDVEMARLARAYVDLARTGSVRAE